MSALTDRLLERLLDIFWLLLFAPSLCLWVRRRSGLQFAPFLLAVSCSLVLLFPIISASDDLRAAKQEVEEPAASKRSVKQLSAPNNRTALPFSAAIPCRLPEITRAAWLGNVAPPAESPIRFNVPESFSGRAPPAFPA